MTLICGLIASSHGGESIQNTAITIGPKQFFSNSPAVIRKLEEERDRRIIMSRVCKTSEWAKRRGRADAVKEGIEEELKNRERDVERIITEINLIEQREQKAAVIQVGEGKEREIFYMDQNGDFWDDVSGARLNKQKIKEARLEEIKQLYKHRVYKKVPLSQCWEDAGKAPIKVAWPDFHKR